MLVFAFSWKASAAESPFVIDWTACTQPDLAGEEHWHRVETLINHYEKAARARFPGLHIAVQLNRIYPQIVLDRRNLVAASYIPVVRRKRPTDCALPEAKYAELLAIRDASYFVLCRSEVAAGTSAAARQALNLKTMTAAAIYDLLKSGVDLRRGAEPTTPAGGYAACTRGRETGLGDPMPTADEVRAFVTRIGLQDSEKGKVGDASKQ